MTTQDEFIQLHEGNLTPDLAAQLLELGEGDTGTSPEKVSEPAAPANEEQGAPEDVLGNPKSERLQQFLSGNLK